MNLDKSVSRSEYAAPTIACGELRSRAVLLRSRWHELLLGKIPLAVAALLLSVAANVALADGTETHTHQATGAVAAVPKSTGTRLLQAGPVTIKMLVEMSNLGRGDIEVGELILPVEAGETPAHQHGSLEIFYVVEGVLGHEVNGVAYRLEPGEVGFVQPGDSVKHAVLSPGPVKAVVIWVPGGEADNLVKHAGFTSAPLP